MKDVSEFYWKEPGKVRRYRCKSCISEVQRERRNNPATRDKVLAWERKSRKRVISSNPRYWTLIRYGLSAEEYEQMWSEQDGKCAICGRTFSENQKSVIDHDHKTGKVRSLLCPSCNNGLGMFGDNTEIMTNAIEYITKHRSYAHIGNFPANA